MWTDLILHLINRPPWGPAKNILKQQYFDGKKTSLKVVYTYKPPPSPPMIEDYWNLYFLKLFIHFQLTESPKDVSHKHQLQMMLLNWNLISCQKCLRFLFHRRKTQTKGSEIFMASQDFNSAGTVWGVLLYLLRKGKFSTGSSIFICHLLVIHG